MTERERIVVAMSGGVDSSVAAALLMEAGHDVVGLFMRNGAVPGPAAARHKQGCCSLDDAMDARHVAARLGVPFFAVNFEREFSRIIDYFADEYDRGRTPNPCIVCNRDLKFGRLLDYADEIGAARVATGHYARVTQRDGRPAIARAIDRDKDQSYVLFPLETGQVARTLLPLGELTKDEVRAEARRFGLPVAEKRESQEICFVPDDDYRAFLRRRRPESLRPGAIVDLAGAEVGRHEGHQLYTIGQRRGLGGGFTRPVYVVAIRPDSNVVVVGDEADLRVGALRVGPATWQGAAPLRAGESLRGSVRVRYQHEPVPASARADEDGLVIELDEPLRAVTPGQAAVFYDGDTVLFGAWIDAPIGGASLEA
ncbi:MAG: tRNA 2-thiouridine(34) synthase MnmA [Planctomycetota bacterium]